MIDKIMVVIGMVMFPVLGWAEMPSESAMIIKKLSEWEEQERLSYENKIQEKRNQVVKVLRGHIESRSRDGNVAASLAISKEVDRITSSLPDRDLTTNLKFKEIEVVSVAHRKNSSGYYFNFRLDDMNHIFGHEKWDDKGFYVVNPRTGHAGGAVFWGETNGGPKDCGHGRFEKGPASGQWKKGDRVLILFTKKNSPK